MTADRLTVFVPTRLVNPTNERVHWSMRSKRAKAQRAAVAMTVWTHLRVPNMGEPRLALWRITARPETPKRITLTGHVARKMDGDNLQAAMKHVRDGLQDCGLIHSDGPDAGHSFRYHQVVSKPLGVTITVEMGGTE